MLFFGGAEICTRQLSHDIAGLDLFFFLNVALLPFFSVPPSFYVPRLHHKGGVRGRNAYQRSNLLGG